MLSDIRVLAGVIMVVFAASFVFAIIGIANTSLIPGSSGAAEEVVVGVTRTPLPVTPTQPAAETPTGGETPAGPATTLQLVAENILFDPTDLQAPAGTVVIELDNRDAGIPHNVAVHAGTDASGELIDNTAIAPGPVQQTLTLQLEPGTYFYVCQVHPATMTGTLTVS